MSNTETVFCCTLIRNPSGGIRPEGWASRVTEHMLSQVARIVSLETKIAALEAEVARLTQELKDCAQFTGACGETARAAVGAGQ